MDLQTPPGLVSNAYHKIDTGICWRGVQREQFYHSSLVFLLWSKGVWGWISTCAAWMMRRRRLPRRRARPSRSVQPCCRCPGDPHQKIQRWHPVGCPRVPGDVLMAGGDEVSGSWFSPGLSLLRNGPRATQHRASRLGAGGTQIGWTLSLGLSFAAYSQLFWYVLGDFMLCVVYCNPLYISPFTLQLQRNFLFKSNSFTWGYRQP